MPHDRAGRFSYVFKTQHTALTALAGNPRFGGTTSWFRCSGDTPRALPKRDQPRPCCCSGPGDSAAARFRVLNRRLPAVDLVPNRVVSVQFCRHHLRMPREKYGRGATVDRGEFRAAFSCLAPLSIMLSPGNPFAPTDDGPVERIAD